MKDLAFRKKLIIKLEEYLKDRISASVQLNKDKKYMTMIEYIKKEDDIDSTENFEYTYIKYTDKELDTMFGYMEDYLLHASIVEFPNCFNDSFFLMYIFGKILTEIKDTDSRYQDVLTYFNCLFATKYTLIDERISGKIENQSQERFIVTDYLGNEFIAYDGSKEQSIEDFGPILTTDDLSIIQLIDYENNSELYILGMVIDDYYWSVPDNAMYPKSKTADEMLSCTTLDYFLECNECSFLAQEVYNQEEASALVAGLNSYSDMDMYDRMILDEVANFAAKWFFNEHDFSAYSKKQAEAYLEKLKILIKKGVLTTTPYFYLFEDVYKSDALNMAENHAQINLKPIYAHMIITNNSVQVMREPEVGFEIVLDLEQKQY